MQCVRAAFKPQPLQTVAIYTHRSAHTPSGVELWREQRQPINRWRRAFIRPPTARALPRLRFSWKWLGVVPFFLFVLAFQLYPSLSIAVRSFLNDAGKLDARQHHRAEPADHHEFVLQLDQASA